MKKEGVPIVGTPILRKFHLKHILILLHLLIGVLFCIFAAKKYEIMAKNLLNKYVWLVETIYKAKKISFKEINPFYFEICN